MLNKTVEAGAGVCLALGKVERVSEVYGRSYTHQVAVELPGGTERAEFALSSDDVINYRLEGGDPVLVTFHPQGQYANVQGLKDVAKSLGLGPVPEAGAEEALTK